jgi:hypothetical protein
MQSPFAPFGQEYVDSLDNSVRSLGARPRAGSEIVDTSFPAVSTPTADSSAQLHHHRQSIQRASFRSHENAAINLREESELHRTVKSLMDDVESHRRQLSAEIEAKEAANESLRKLRMEVLELQEQLHQYQRNEVVSRMREETLRSELAQLKGDVRTPSPALGRVGSFKVVRLSSTAAEQTLFWAEANARKLMVEHAVESVMSICKMMMHARQQLVVQSESSHRQETYLRQLDSLNTLQLDFQAHLLHDFWKNQFSDLRSVASSLVAERRGPAPWYPPGVPNVNYRRDVSKSPARQVTPPVTRTVSPVSHRTASPASRAKSPPPSSAVSAASSAPLRPRLGSPSPRGSSYGPASPVLSRAVVRAGSPNSPRVVPPVQTSRTVHSPSSALSPGSARGKVSLSRTVENMESLLRELQKWRHTYQ